MIMRILDSGYDTIQNYNWSTARRKPPVIRTEPSGFQTQTPIVFIVTIIRYVQHLITFRRNSEFWLWNIGIN